MGLELFELSKIGRIGRIRPVGALSRPLIDAFAAHVVSALPCEVYDHRKIRLCGVTARKHAGRSHPS